MNVDTNTLFLAVGRQYVEMALRLEEAYAAVEAREKRLKELEAEVTKWRGGVSPG